jgi:pimeloyl-ACP methyl ester carboxylesterase
MHKLLFVSFVTPFLLVGNIALASTAVSGTIPADTTWTLANSPYVVTSDMDIPVGVTLTVEAGVVVKFQYATNMTVEGTLHAVGTLMSPIYFTSFTDDVVGGDTNGDGVDTTPYAGWWHHIEINAGGTGVFDYVTVRYAGWFPMPSTGIANNGGTVALSHSILASNGFDGYAHHGGTSTITYTEIMDHSYYGVFVSNDGSGFHMHHGNIHDNGMFALYAPDATVVDATHNYWGTLTGPLSFFNPDGMGNEVSPEVQFIPFLVAPPVEGEVVTCTENCNSNVLFLPGLQASRLYRPDYNGGTDRLWEPNGNADVQDLYLGADGKSLRSDVYATEVIDEIFGLTPDIYKTFITMMNEMKDVGTIVDWSPIPYDWRLSIDDILNNGTKIDAGYSYHTASATPYIFEEVERLARSSKTGKVTLIGHSNGGLVAKALMVRLEQMGKAELIDKVILLASPQLGTPKAIASILHGEDQEYLGGILMNKPTARRLAQNMPGAYQLLPSAKYFDIVTDPSIIIRNSTSTGALYGAYGTSTNTISELYALLRGDEGRMDASFEDVESLGNLNNTLLTQAKDLHALLDGWIAPTSTEVVEIAGWGLDTIRGIRYSDRAIAGCTVGECRRLTYTPLFTDEGDGTVVVPSAMTVGSSTRYWVDLVGASDRFSEKWEHINFTEVFPVQDFLKSLILKQQINALPTFVSTSTPNKIYKKLRYTLHSPLSIGIRDNTGRYTGRASTTILGVEYPIITEEIPNSYYMEFGETKIVGFEEGSTTISMVGEALGVFTLEGERILGGVTMSSTTFPDIPVATGTVVTLLQPIGALTPVIAIDFDGNGATDIIVGEDGFSEVDAVLLLRGMTSALGLGVKQEKRLLTIIDRLERVMQKEFKKPEKKVARLGKVLDRLAVVTNNFALKGKITNDDRVELLRVIEIISGQVI